MLPQKQFSMCCLGLDLVIKNFQILRRVLSKNGDAGVVTEVYPSSHTIHEELLINWFSRHRASCLNVLKQNSVLCCLPKILLRISQEFLGAHRTAMINPLSLNIRIGGGIDRVPHDRANSLRFQLLGRGRDFGGVHSACCKQTGAEDNDGCRSDQNSI